jgi:hypothetical protein
LTEGQKERPLDVSGRDSLVETAGLLVSSRLGILDRSGKRKVRIAAVAKGLGRSKSVRAIPQ